MSDKSEIIPSMPIENRIYVLRKQKVMLDSDLAELYGVETKVLNQAVKRNIERFPEEFMFQLSNEEFEILRSQNVTSSPDGLRSQNVTLKDMGGVHRKYLPYVFTEDIKNHLAKIGIENE